MENVPARAEKKSIPRQEMPTLSPEERRHTFAEVNLGYAPELAAMEASRCIFCKNAKCVDACPLQNDIPRYLKALMEGRYGEALFQESVPLTAVCGRVCYRPCEAACVVGIKREPVAINALERFAADYYYAQWGEDGGEREGVSPRYGRKIAVVGSGPAGLVCAYNLATLGYRVTVFEEAPVIGGMLSLGIPEYRLPPRVTAREVETLRRQGVEFVLNTTVGRDLSLEALQREYAAIFLAVGAHRGRRLGIPGEGEYEGFLDAIAFLRRVNLGDKSKPGINVIVIGGGDSAIDAARTALRLGSAEVTILYRRSRAEMPANPGEVGEAEEEGVRVFFLAAPVKVLGEDGRVTGMECVRMQLGEPDASGRPRPVPIPGSEFFVAADCIIPAISQDPNLSFLPDGHRFQLTRWNTFAIQPETLETSVAGVFAGGDAVTGPKTVAEAMATGRQAARAIDRYLQGEGSAKIRDLERP